MTTAGIADIAGNADNKQGTINIQNQVELANEFQAQSLATIESKDSWRI